MSTLDTNYLKKQAKTYLIISAFCFIFGVIYEIFSHKVYSAFMLFAFLIPLILGFLFSFILVKAKKQVGRVSMNLYNASIATFTVYSIFRGVLEIYGITNNLINYYIWVGELLLVFSLFLELKRIKKVG